MRKTHKVLRAPITDELYLMKKCLASAGPGASVVGMRKYWGQDAYMVRCGQFIYNMREEDYSYYLEWD